MNSLRRLTTGLMVLSSITTMAQHTSSLWGQNGERWDPRGRLPDYSWAGYTGGEEEIPDAGTLDWPEISITNYGAVANDSLDDQTAFENAVAAAPAGGAIITVPQGRFELHNWMTIRRSNLVIKGDPAGGSEIYLPNSAYDIDPSNQSRYATAIDGFFIRFEGYSGNNSVLITEGARRGDRTLTVANGSGFYPGQPVELLLTDAATDGPMWNLMNIDYTGPLKRDPMDSWVAFGGRWGFTVERVDGNLVTLREPLRFDVHPEWSWATAPQLRMANERNLEMVGVEDLKISCHYIPQPSHLQEPGYNAIEMKYVRNGWVRRVEIEHSDNGIALDNANFVTLSDITFSGRAGHHGIEVTQGGCHLTELLDFQVTDGTKAWIHAATFNHECQGCVCSKMQGNLTVTMDLHRDSPFETLFTETLSASSYNSSGSVTAGPHTAARTTYWNIYGQMGVPCNGNANSYWGMIQTTVVTDMTDPSSWIVSVPDRFTETAEWFEDVPNVHPANLYEAQLTRRKNLPAAPDFTDGPLGVHSNWFERDPARWRIQEGTNPAYELRFGEAPALSGGRLGEYSVFTNTPQSQIGLKALSLENPTGRPDADVALVLGWQDDENYLYAAVGATGGASIVRVQNGTGTMLSSDPAIQLVSNAWKSISFARSGNTIELTYDAQTLQATDTLFTAGYAGIGSTTGRAAFDTNPNTAPVASNAVAVLAEDSTTGITLTGSDADSDPLTYTTTFGPLHGTLSGTAPNLTYTPDTNYFGTDYFIYTVHDGSVNSAEATISITVNAMADAPAFSVDPIIGTVGITNTPYSGSLTDTATDADGDGLTYSKTGGPTWLYVATNGILSGTPGVSALGPNSFTVEVGDGNGGTDSAVLKIGVGVLAGIQTIVLEQWVYNDPSGTRLYDAINSGTIGTAWNWADTTWITDGAGNLTLSGAIGNDWKSSEIYSPHLTDSGTYTYEMTISAWSHDAAAAGSSLKSKIRNEDGTTMAEVQFHFDADKAHATINSGNTNYRNIDLGGLSGGPVTLRVDFNLETRTSEYFIDGVSQYTFSNLNPDVMTEIKDISFSREGGWASAAMSLSVDQMKLSREGLVVVVDSDGDGLTDAQEIALGTNPNDSDSKFIITDTTPLPMSGKIEITWPSATGILYRVWKSPDLTNWSVARDWTNALSPPVDIFEIDLTPSNGFLKVEAEIQ